MVVVAGAGAEMVGGQRRVFGMTEVSHWLSSRGDSGDGKQRT